MERLDELSLGIGKQKTFENVDCPPVASPATADHMAPSSDVLQALFDTPQQTLVHLGLAVRQDQDPSLSESHSWDLPLGVLLRAVPTTSGLR